MNNFNKKYFLLGFLLMAMAACKKPYEPSVIAADNSYLVVEGLINTGPDSTYIKLSRTVKLDNGSTSRPQLNATVTVESDQGNKYTLQENGEGLYSSPALNLSPSAKYRLRINTANSKEYLSDYVVAKSTPDIDSISFNVQNGGVQFYANTHDPQNNTRYYRWDFDETWQYVSALQSFFIIGQDSLPQTRNVYKDSSLNVYNCYFTSPSHQVLLGSSAKLAQDVISKQEISFVTPESGKLSHAYSIMLRQYALTPDAFTYWQLLKKNTEQLGSIFDAQPSSLKGNIHNVGDSNEPVIGFISASSVKRKRLYVDRYNIKLGFPYYLPPPGTDACNMAIHYIPVAPENTFKERLYHAIAKGDSLILFAIQPATAPAVIGYYYVAKYCSDCRAKQPYGTNVKPAFFPF